MALVKPKEMLIIDPPNELKFIGPFSKPVVTTLKLENPTNQTILFKIKTTAPKRYCVRPNFGSVSPHQQTNVEICLQPFMYDPTEKNKHKFMVQYVATYDDGDDLSSLWKEATPEIMMDAKLKCVFEVPAAMTSTGDTSGSGIEKVKEILTKTLNEEKLSNLQTSDQSQLMVELSQLRDENNVLRKENFNLKEQVVVLRCSTVKPQIDETYTPIMADNQIPVFYIAMALFAAIFGVILGKFIF